MTRGDVKAESFLALGVRRHCSTDFQLCRWKVAAAYPGRIAVVPVGLAELMSRLRRYEAAMKPGSYSSDALQESHTRRSQRDIPPGRQKFVMLGRLAIEASSGVGHRLLQNTVPRQASGAKQVVALGGGQGRAD